ncbi:MAG: hypothetical protein HY052_05475 [Proteobacteria bacterium]|nr:hypothetical protein [Pseudomonadota bacterium]
MAKKALKKYCYDISLSEGAGAHLVSWVTGLMVFFVTLALLVNFSLATITKTWVTGLSGALTVEIKPPLSPKEGGEPSSQSQKKFENSVHRVLTLLKDNAAVSEARLMTDAEIRSLIQPWMGPGVTVDAVYLPALIDIKLTPNADVARLQSDLKAVEPDAGIDSHTDTLDDVKALVKTASLFVLLLTSVIVVLAVVAISGIVRSKLLIHESEVETLHLIGASDEYIARQFRMHTLRGTLKGALIGLVCTLAILLVIGSLTHTLDDTILPHLKWAPLQWLLVVVSPIAVGSLIAHLTAQATVLKELSKLT